MSEEVHYDNISLDEAVLISINMHLDRASYALLEDDYDSVIVNLDFAWRSLSPKLRKIVGVRPGERIYSLLTKEHGFDDSSPRGEIIVNQKVSLVVNEVHTRIVDTLDAAGLWIASRGRFKPASELEPRKELPSSKLDEKYSR